MTLVNYHTWDLDRSDGGVHILPPYQSAKGATWFKGTANAIYQNVGFVDMYDPDYVLILSGDHIYKMDYAAMLAHHKRVHADCTIAVMEVPWDEASRFGIMNVDGEDTITEFEEKPKQPRSNLASMGIYVFSWKKLRAYLITDENDADSSNDFGKNIIPAMLNAGEKMSAYRFEGYWKDVGTLDSLWDANMDMLAQGSGLNLLDKDWPIYARAESEPPAYLGETVRRPDRDNAIDVYTSDEYEDVLADGVWQNTFKVRPEVLTAEEKKAWIATQTGVTVGSDAFFPFGDNVERARKSGVTYIAEPGGSIRDDHVIATADKYGMVLAFTGARLFHH